MKELRFRITKKEIREQIKSEFMAGERIITSPERAAIIDIANGIINDGRALELSKAQIIKSVYDYRIEYLIEAYKTAASRYRDTWTGQVRM